MTLQHKPQEATEMPLLGYDASRQNFIGLHKKLIHLARRNYAVPVLQCY